jgi:hypothetical protein
MQVKCESCGDLFPKERFDLGFKICLECSEELTPRYLGRRVFSGKNDSSLEIIRQDIESAKLRIQKENRKGLAK